MIKHKPVKRIAVYFIIIIGVFLSILIYTVSALTYTSNQYEHIINYMLNYVVDYDNFEYQFNSLRLEMQNTRLFAIIINFLAFGFAIAATFFVGYLTTSSFRVKEEDFRRLEKEASDRAKLMLDGSPVACYLFDMKFDAIDCNQEALKLFDMPNKEKGIDLFGLIFFLNDPLTMIEHVNEVIQNGFHRFEWELASMPCQITFIRFNHNDEAVIAAYIFDLSPFHNMVEDMKRIAIAEENSKTKSRFLARTSHEIRTPITAVLGIAEIQLQNPELTLIVEEAFAKIYNSSQILLGIINDILDLSKIEAGKMNILHEKYEAASLINDIVQLNMFRIGSKKIKFNIHIDENIPAMLVGDELRLKQIMNNLLSNAFKYTESGCVNLIIKCRQDSANDDIVWLTFTVRDTGCGMTETQINNLFVEYVRFNESDNRYIEGAGLGMSIVQNLTSLMDAKLDVESQVDEGSTFIVDVPQEKSGDEILGSDLAENLQNFRMTERSIAKRIKFTPEPMPYGNVLVVDDVDTNLYVAKGLLSFFDLRIDTCENGYEALDITEDKVYDIVFMDHMMPGIDGMETTAIMRKRGYSHPIVALTANAVIGQAEVFLKNGFDGFVSKPIDITHLNAVLNRFIRDKQPPEVVEAARKNSVYFNPDLASKVEMWDYLSNPSGGTEFARTLRKEFARTQKDATRDILKDISAGDIKTARRRVHTLKGLAHTIGENNLADMAAQLEQLLETDDHQTQSQLANLIEILGEQLEIVLDAIPNDDIEQAENMTGNNITRTGVASKNILDSDVAKAGLEDIFNDLQEALENSTTGALGISKKLGHYPEAAVLIRQIEDFDFDSALKTLSVLKEMLI